MAVQQDVERVAEDLRSGSLQNCTEFSDFVVTDSVQDLSPLVNLSGSVNSIVIYQATKLSNLNGLEGITALAGSSDVDQLGYPSLSLLSNPVLTSIDALRNIRGASPGSVFIGVNPALASLQGLGGITSIDRGYLMVKMCSSLRSLDGLGGLTSIGPGVLAFGFDEVWWSITIESNENLRGIDALSSLRGPLSAPLRVMGNPLLRSLDGLEGITSIGQGAEGYVLLISSNLALESLNGLRNAHMHAGILDIVDSPALTCLDGLDSVQSLSGLEIAENFELRSISALGNLSSISGGLTISSNYALSSLVGLHGLNNVTGKISIQSNNELMSLDGLQGLRSLHDFEINGNNKITSIAALGNASGWMGHLNVAHNPALLSLHGLSRITGAQSITIQENTRLRSIAGLMNIRHVDRGEISILGNLDLQSLRGPDWQAIFVGVGDGAGYMQKFKLGRSGDNVCFAPEDQLPNSNTHIVVMQPPVSWNASRCHSCANTCGTYQGSPVDCDYGSGRCRCPLGRIGPNCSEQAARVSVHERQLLDLSRRSDYDVSYKVDIRLCLSQPADQDTLNVSSLALFDTCTGTAVSRSCGATGSEVDFEVQYDKEPVVKWDGGSSMCGTLTTDLLIKSGGLFEPSKEAVLQVGYHPQLYPDILLEGTLQDPPVSPSPPVFPWCVDSGDCKRVSPVGVRVRIAGRERQCAAGSYAIEGKPECHPCGDHSVSNIDQNILEEGQDPSQVCKACSLWEEPSESNDACVFLWWTIWGLAASFFSLVWGLALLGTQLAFSRPLGRERRLTGRVILVQDISSEKGTGVVLTTCGRHGLQQRMRQSSPIFLSGTGNKFLDSSPELRLRMRVLGEDRLELLDVDGMPLDGERDASMGQFVLPALASLMHTGRYAPVAFAMPFLMLAGLVGIVFWFHSMNAPAADVVVALLVASSASAALACGWRRRKSPPPLQRRLALYREKLQHENPKPQPCERGPGRAVRVGQMLDLLDYFKAFVQSRSMYYLEPNIIRPLTACYQLSFAEVAGPSPVEWFVSHFWGHEYAQTCAALAKHAQFACPGPNWRSVAYWVCTLSINQYKVQEELGDSCWHASSFYLALRSPGCRGTCMVLDESLLPLARSWCLFELLQTLVRSEEEDPESRVPGADRFTGMLFCTSSGILSHGEANTEVSLNVGKGLANLRLEDASASCEADKAMIDGLVVSQLGGFDEINRKLRSSIRTAVEASREATLRDFDSVAHALGEMGSGLGSSVEA